MVLEVVVVAVVVVVVVGWCKHCAIEVARCGARTPRGRIQTACGVARTPIAPVDLVDTTAGH